MRAQARKERADEEARQHKELECGAAVAEKATEETEEDSKQGELDWMQDLDDELIINGRDKVKLTRSQKRENKKQYQDKEDEIPKRALDISAKGAENTAGDILPWRQLGQQLRENLLQLGQDSSRKMDYCSGDGYPLAAPGCRMEEMAVKQLVLPVQCRETVLRLGHEVPLAGHLGKHKAARDLAQILLANSIQRCTGVPMWPVPEDVSMEGPESTTDTLARPALSVD